jgi:hypothetical protein
MNLLLLLLLALPFACLAVLSLVAFLGVADIAGALHVIGTITSAWVSLFKKMQTRGTARSVMLTRSIMLRLNTSSSLNVPKRLPSLFQPKSRY